MKRGERVMRPDVKRIGFSAHWVDLIEGQTFAETARAWELWTEEPLPRRIMRWPKNKVLWIIPKEGVI